MGKEAGQVVCRRSNIVFSHVFFLLSIIGAVVHGQMMFTQMTRDGTLPINACICHISPDHNVLYGGRWQSQLAEWYSGNFCAVRLPANLDWQCLGSPTGFGPSFLRTVSRVARPPCAEDTTGDQSSKSYTLLRRLAQLLLHRPQPAPWNPLLEFMLATGRPGPSTAVPTPSPLLAVMMQMPGFGRRFFVREDAAAHLVIDPLLLSVAGRHQRVVNAYLGLEWLTGRREQCMALLMIHHHWCLPAWLRAVRQLPAGHARKWYRAAVAAYVVLVANGGLAPLNAVDESDGQSVVDLQTGPGTNQTFGTQGNLAQERRVFGRPAVDHGVDAQIAASVFGANAAVMQQQQQQQPQQRQRKLEAEQQALLLHARRRVHHAFMWLVQHEKGRLLPALVNAAQQLCTGLMSGQCANSDAAVYQLYTLSSTNDTSPIATPPEPTLHQLLDSFIACSTASNSTLRDVQLKSYRLLHWPTGSVATTDSPAGVTDVPLLGLHPAEAGIVISRLLRTAVLAILQHGLPGVDRFHVRDVFSGERWTVEFPPTTSETLAARQRAQLKWAQRLCTSLQPLATAVSGPLTLLQQQLHCAVSLTSFSLHTTGNDGRPQQLLTMLRAATGGDDSFTGTEEGTEAAAPAADAAAAASSAGLPSISAEADVGRRRGAHMPLITLQGQLHWAMIADALHDVARLPALLQTHQRVPAILQHLQRGADGGRFFLRRWHHPVQLTEPLPRGFEHAMNPSLIRGDSVVRDIPMETWNHQSSVGNAVVAAAPPPPGIRSRTNNALDDADVDWDDTMMVTAPAPVIWQLGAPDASSFLRMHCYWAVYFLSAGYLAYLQREGPSFLAAQTPHTARATVVRALARSKPRFQQRLDIQRHAMLTTSMRALFDINRTSTVAVEFVGEVGTGDGVTRGWFYQLSRLLLDSGLAPPPAMLPQVGDRDYLDDEDEEDEVVRLLKRASLEPHQPPLFYEPGAPGFCSPWVIRATSVEDKLMQRR